MPPLLLCAFHDRNAFPFYDVYYSIYVQQYEVWVIAQERILRLETFATSFFSHTYGIFQCNLTGVIRIHASAVVNTVILLTRG